MNDEQLSNFLEAHTDQVIKQFGGYSRMDSYLLKDGQLAGFLERKTRNVPIGHYDTAIIDFQKYQGMQYLEAATSLNCGLAVGWSCGTVRRSLVQLQRLVFAVNVCSCYGAVL